MLKWTIINDAWIQVWVEVAFVNGRLVEVAKEKGRAA